MLINCYFFSLFKVTDCCFCKMFTCNLSVSLFKRGCSGVFTSCNAGEIPEVACCTGILINTWYVYELLPMQDDQRLLIPVRYSFQRDVFNSFCQCLLAVVSTRWYLVATCTVSMLAGFCPVSMLMLVVPSSCRQTVEMSPCLYVHRELLRRERYLIRSLCFNVFLSSMKSNCCNFSTSNPFYNMI